VAADIRNHGTKNPDAVMFGRGPYTVDDILASEMVAAPFHLLDLSLVAQGGAAMVLTTRDRAKDLKGKGVVVLGAALEIAQASYVNPPLYREVGQLGRSTAARLLSDAGLSVADIDVYSLYDQNSFEVIRQLEVLGLCAEGEGGPFVEAATLSPDGDLPTNLDGGLLAHSWCGVQSTTMKIIECARHIRGDAGGHQVQGAEIAVATNAGPGTHYWGMGLFGAM
jgi:acetyl-CoA acetyltransferase